MNENIYAERDHEAQGELYLRHLDRMTVEKLHSKSDIAGELAHRDAEIAALRKDAERLDFLDGQSESYGFQDIHEGNRWLVEGPFRSIRVAIDADLQAQAV